MTQLADRCQCKPTDQDQKITEDFQHFVIIFAIRIKNNMKSNQIPGSGAVSRMGLTVSLGSFVLSFTSVCLTNIAPLLKIKNDLTQQQLIFQLSIATSCFNVGTIISPIFYRKFIKYFGELNSFNILDITGIFLLVLQLIKLDFYLLSMCRILLGLVIGISTSIISSFINSIAPHQIYARIGCYTQTVQTIGVAVAYSLNYILEPDNPHDQIRWRIYMGFPIIPFLMRIIILRVFYPYNSIESHIKRQQLDKIKSYCHMVYHKDDEQTVEELIKMKSLSKISHENQRTWRRRFIVGIVVIASNQFSGINGILFYAKQLFLKITHDRADYTQVIMILLSLMQIVSTIISSEVADIKGRKKMLLGGQSILAIILFLIFVFDTILGSIIGQVVMQSVVIFLIFVHVFVMNFTLGNLCVVYCAQILEDITWIIITLKSLSFLVALTTEYMIEYLGLGQMFLIFFGLTVCALIFLKRNMYETKGLTTSQIYSSFDRTHSLENQSLLTSQQIREEPPLISK